MRLRSAARLQLLVPFALAAAVLVPPASAAGESSLARSASRQLIVQFAARTSVRVENARLGALGLRRVRTIGGIGAVVASAPSPASALHAIGLLRGERGVRYAEQNRVAHVEMTPSDPDIAFSGGNDWPLTLSKIDQAWDFDSSGSATVAVVDTGVDASNPDLSGSVLTGYNEIAASTNTADDNGHGTEVSGVIAAHIDNGIGVAGVCSGCKILPVKALDASGAGTAANIASGITWAADNGAQVINLSLGGTVGDATEQSAIGYAQGKGVLVVAAAGNAGSTDPTVSPGGYPGADSGVLSVGGSDYDNNLYYYSNYGSWVQVAAPGCAMTTEMGGGYGSFCGTSAATPFVAGLAALALSANRR